MDVRTVEEEFAFSIRVCISYALEVQVELAVFYSLKHQVFNEIVKKNLYLRFFFILLRQIILRVWQIPLCQMRYL